MKTAQKRISRQFRNLFSGENSSYTDPSTNRKQDFSFKPKMKYENQTRKQRLNPANSMQNNFQTYLVVKQINPKQLADSVQNGPAISKFLLDSVNYHPPRYTFPFKPINLPNNFTELYDAFKDYIKALHDLTDIEQRNIIRLHVKTAQERNAYKKEIEKINRNEPKALTY